MISLGFRIIFFLYICECQLIVLISGLLTKKASYYPLMKGFLNVLILVLLIAGSVSAQQDPQLSMYMFNKQYMNPAHAGSLRATQFSLSGRLQWVSIDGAPNTGLFSINGPADRLGGGIGGYMMVDRIGPINTLGAGGQYAFRIVTTRKPIANTPTSVLQLGIGLGFWQKSINPEWRYDTRLGFDPTLLNGIQSSIAGDVNAGLYFYVPFAKDPGRHKYWFSFTTNHLLEPTLQNFTTTNLSKVYRQFYAASGYQFKVSKTQNLFLEPSAIIKSDLVSFQYDFNVNLHVSPLVFGMSYRGRLIPSNSSTAQTSNQAKIRNRDALVGIVGFHTNNRLFIGYSYDYTLSTLGQFTSGTHEIVVSYTFPKPNKLPRPEFNTIDKNLFD